MVFLWTALAIASCSQGKVEELSFRWTLEYKFIQLCGKDKECAAAVKSQIQSCLEKSHWRQYLEHSEDNREFERFASAFYPCIVDQHGHPYFHKK